MDKRSFQIIALTPAGVADARLVLAADRAGCLGILNAGVGLCLLRFWTRCAAARARRLASSSQQSTTRFCPVSNATCRPGSAGSLSTPRSCSTDLSCSQRMTGIGLRVIVEVTEWDDRLAALSGHHALQVKGHEAGGLISEETSFILFAEGARASVGSGLCARRCRPARRAAVRAAGAAGVVLDDQLLLL